MTKRTFTLGVLNSQDMNKIIFCIVIWLSSYTPLLCQGKIDSAVLKRFDLEDTVSCFLILGEQLSTINIPEDLNKIQKGEIVYDTLLHIAQSSQVPIIQYLEEHSIKYQSFFIVNTILVKIDLTHLQTIVQSPSISRVLPDFTIAAPQNSKGVDNRSTAYLNWAIERIRADSVWARNITGQNTVIGGQDTGYEWDHYLLKSKYRGYQSENKVEHAYHWFDAITEANALHGDTVITDSTNPCGFSAKEPCDDNGHGTHTMGIMLGSSGNQYSGIAPDAKWVGTRVMDRGYGQLSTYLSGLQWFMAPSDTNQHNPDPSLAPHVINNSWACPVIEGCNVRNYWMLDTAISRLNQSGVFVVTSAGNEGREGCNSLKNPPAIFKSGFTVGTTNRNDSIADFSSKGSWPFDFVKPEVVAPGVAINSAYLNGTTRSLSGTSMSGPVVAGIVSLMISANPDLAGKIKTIRQILLKSTVPITENACGPQEIPNPVYGYGRIDALLAVQNAMKIQTPLTDIAKEPALKMYPNPVSSQFHISLGSVHHLVEIQIMNINGQVMVTQKKRNIREFTVNTETLKSGIYFVSIKFDNKSEVKKLIKL
ncbi:S8/S53 family peptidase [Membranihabitans maritimus]|uniref:S8/S53 family peptidase n=1 Tax=Membranihabitans maritimus TaxID=2904244 RepID=UPI001F3FC376|nr:S8/S53 family peptidase [Membranihabitans maritimus]